jgi:outer membrane protein TolC
MSPATPRRAEKWRDQVHEVDTPEADRSEGDRSDEVGPADFATSSERSEFSESFRLVSEIGEDTQFEAVEGGQVGLTLTEAIQGALHSNPDLHSSTEQIRIADATLQRARAEFYPELGIVGSYSATDVPAIAFQYQTNQANLNLRRDITRPGIVDNFQTRLVLQQSLYDGGRRKAQSQAAQAQRDVAVDGLSTLQNQLVFHVAEAYYRLLQVRDLLRVRSEAVHQVENHLQTARLEYQAGQTTKSDVLMAEVHLAEVREVFLSTKNQFELSWAVLENVTGSRFSQRVLPKRVQTFPWKSQVEEVKTVIAEALDRRPELSVLAHSRRATEYDLQAARAGKSATIDFIADYQVFTGDFSRVNDGFFVGLVLKLNVFDAGRTKSEVSRVAAQLRELRSRRRRLMLDIELDVRRAYLGLLDAEERIKVGRQAVIGAVESLREVEVQSRNRMATMTQLIDAQVALSESRVRHTNAQADMQVARIALRRAVGRLGSLFRAKSVVLPRLGGRLSAASFQETGIGGFHLDRRGL